jgi:hypothetical protein
MTHGLQSFQAKYLCSLVHFNSRYVTHICHHAEIMQKLKVEGWKPMVGAEPKCYRNRKEGRSTCIQQPLLVTGSSIFFIVLAAVFSCTL